MKFPLIMSALSALVIGHSLFLAVFFWTAKTKRNLSNRLLALLLLALAVRIFKSIIIVLYPQGSDFWPSIGLIGMAAIGPFLWLYLKSLFYSDFRINYSQLLHFSLSALLLVAIFYVDRLRVLYEVTIYQMLLYLGFSYYLLWQHRAVLQKATHWRSWLHLLLMGVICIWATFAFQLYFASPVTYVAVTAVAAFVLYGLSFWGMRRRKILEHQFPIESDVRLDTNMELLGKKIKEQMEQDRLFTDPKLTVRRLAKILNQPNHQVSKTVNVYFKRTFPEVLNAYRINAAQGMLQNPDFQHLSIEAIAYESGFQSLSAFYAAFKKNIGMTPAQYRKQFSVV